MQSTSLTSPMPTMPHDAMNEIVMRLPDAESTKPWRDVNSLATTCKGFYYWKKRVVDINVETEWKRVSAEVAKAKGCLNALQVILDDHGNPARRLFREPILRKITKIPEPLTTGKRITSVNNFNASLYLMRETVSFYEILSCFQQFVKEPLLNKLQLIEKLPSFLPNLKNLDRQTVLKKMFDFIDEDMNLCELLKEKNSTFIQIKNSLGDDQESQILLEICLYSRKILPRTLNLSRAENGLKQIPNFERWNWVYQSAPEFLTTDAGLEVMLNDPACRKQMIGHLNQEFLKCKDFNKFDLYRKLFIVFSKLCEYQNGKKLVKKLIHWFLKTTTFGINKDSLKSGGYEGLFIGTIALIETNFNQKEKKLLREKLAYILRNKIQKREFESLTEILFAVAKYDIKLFKNSIINNVVYINKEILKYVLDEAAFEPSVENRHGVITALRDAAECHHLADSKFFSSFIGKANRFLRHIDKTSNMMIGIDRKSSSSEDYSSTNSSNDDFSNSTLSWS